MERGHLRRRSLGEGGPCPRPQASAEPSTHEPSRALKGPFAPANDPRMRCSTCKRTRVSALHKEPPRGRMKSAEHHGERTPQAPKPWRRRPLSPARRPRRNRQHMNHHGPPRVLSLQPMTRACAVPLTSGQECPLSIKSLRAPAKEKREALWRGDTPVPGRRPRRNLQRLNRHGP